MIIAKKNKLFKQDNKGSRINFYIILIKHKRKKQKGLFSLKLSYYTSAGVYSSHYIFHYEELTIPKNKTVKEWICLLFLKHYNSDSKLQTISEKYNIKEFLELFKKQIDIKNF